MNQGDPQVSALITPEQIEQLSLKFVELEKTNTSVDLESVITKIYSAVNESILNTAHAEFEQLSQNLLSSQLTFLQQLRPIFAPVQFKVDQLKKHLKNLVEGQASDVITANQEKYPTLFDQYRQLERTTEDLTHRVKREQQLVADRRQLFAKAQSIRTNDELTAFITTHQSEIEEITGNDTLFAQIEENFDHSYATGQVGWQNLPEFLQPAVKMLLEKYIESQKNLRRQYFNQVIKDENVTVEQIVEGLTQLTWFVPADGVLTSLELATELSDFWNSVTFTNPDSSSLRDLLPEHLRFKQVSSALLQRLEKHPGFIKIKLETIAGSTLSIEELIQQLTGVSGLYFWKISDNQDLSVFGLIEIIKYAKFYLSKHLLVPKWHFLFWSFGLRKRKKSELKFLIPQTVQRALQDSTHGFDLLPTIVSSLLQYQAEQTPPASTSEKPPAKVKKIRKKNWLLLGNDLLIGKSRHDLQPDIDLKKVSNTPHVSAQQAWLRGSPHGYLIMDYGSASGTFIKRLSEESMVQLEVGVPVPLEQGDIIRFGTEFLLQFQMSNGKQYLIEFKNA